MKKLFYILSFWLFCIIFSESIILPVKAQVASSAFHDLNIQLSKDIASEYSVGNAILIEGKVLDGNKNILFF